MANDFLVGFLKGLHESGVANPSFQPQQPDPATQIKLKEMGYDVKPSFGGKPSIGKMALGALLPSTQGYSITPTQEGFQGNKDYMTKDQAQAYLKDIKDSDKFLGTFQGNKVPRQEVSSYRSSAGTESRVKALEEMAGTRKGQLDLTTRTQILDRLNALNQSSGGTLGQAANIQFRASRGKELLNNPDIAQDPTIYELVKSDLASIAQGGAPNIETAQSASYNSYKKDAIALLQKITAEPQSVNTPEIKKQLNSIFDGMNNLSQGLIDRNAGMVKAAYGDLLDEKTWNSLLYASALGGRVQTGNQATPTPLSTAPPGTPIAPPNPTLNVNPGPRPMPTLGARPMVPQGTLGGRAFRSEQEAATANLPKGTVITIGGRRAMVQ